MSKAADNHMLTRREVVEIAHVSLNALDKAIEQNIVTVHRRRDGSWLCSDDVGVVALLQKTALPLPITVKRKIRRWVHETQPYRAEHGTELHISDALVVRWSPEISETVHAAESYARLRNQWIETNPEIKGGEPVIRGTRIGVRGIAQRMDEGDTIEILTEDYPQVPAEAFQTAHTYGKAHPRRGRPTRPWRDADIKHFLVTRDVTRHETTVVEFGTDYEAAQDAYQEAEQKARGRRDLDVVLLSADSLETIKLTHSSYFEPKRLDELLPA